MKIDGLGEDIFLQTYNAPGGPILPSHWNLIYQEGVRSNHLLFTAEDLSHFETHASDLTKNLIEADAALEPAIDKLWLAQDIRSMQSIISDQPQSIKFVIFRYYQNLLRDWREYLKRVLD